MQKWEYCYIDVTGTTTVARFVADNSMRDEPIPQAPGHVLSYMASLGALGWELAGIEVLPLPEMRSAAKISTSSTVYWFKRQL